MTHRSLAFLTASLLAAAGFGLPAPAAATDTETGVLVETGRESFARHCSACHGMQANGKGILAPVLRTPPSDLTRIAARRGGVFPDAEIAAYIDGRAAVTAHGSREMPVWGRVFAEPVADGTTAEEVVRGQLWVLVEYLKSIQAPAEPAP